MFVFKISLLKLITTKASLSNRNNVPSFVVLSQTVVGAWSPRLDIGFCLQ